MEAVSSLRCALPRTLCQSPHDHDHDHPSLGLRLLGKVWRITSVFRYCHRPSKAT